MNSTSNMLSQSLSQICAVPDVQLFCFFAPEYVGIKHTYPNHYPEQERSTVRGPVPYLYWYRGRQHRRACIIACVGWASTSAKSEHGQEKENEQCRAHGDSSVPQGAVALLEVFEVRRREDERNRWQHGVKGQDQRTDAGETDDGVGRGCGTQGRRNAQR